MIKTIPDPILGGKSSPVSDGDKWEEALEEMGVVLDEYTARGVAAIQIGVPLRMFLMRSGKAVKTVINPSINAFSKEKVSEAEGCLSCPGANVIVSRPERVYVCFQTTPTSLPVQVWLKGSDARVFQHEMDHLDGRLIVSRKR